MWPFSRFATHKSEKKEESFQPKAYQKHGTHKKDAKNFKVEEDNDGLQQHPHPCKPKEPTCTYKTQIEC